MFSPNRKRRDATAVAEDDDFIVANGKEDSNSDTPVAGEVGVATMPYTGFSCGIVHRAFLSAIAAPWVRTEEHALLLSAIDHTAAIDGVCFGAITVKSSFVVRKGGNFLL